ncbi:MAG: 5'/3'-nucleotidase SurE [Pseudobacteriovorax sp.]|nr:5'/3'-nucleotidase SurE [Pseudobacteriovorax sp.]
MKRILTLLTNDDGVHAEGMDALLSGLNQLVEPVVVAPLTEKSGASSSITLGRDIHLVEKDDDLFAFDGTPVDCVAFALRNLLREKPELCISGINMGENLGNDTLCSGTVGAALAAAQEGIPAIAISIVGRSGPYHFDTAIAVLKRLLMKKHEIFREDQKSVLNINVPNLPLPELKGIKVCSLGQRVWSEEFLPGTDSGSFRYNHADPVNFGGTDIDVTEIRNGYATISVLQASLFNPLATESLRKLPLWPQIDK